MAAPKFLQRILGVATSVSAVQAGGIGSTAQNKIIATDATGRVAPSLISIVSLLFLGVSKMDYGLVSSTSTLAKEDFGNVANDPVVLVVDLGYVSDAVPFVAVQ